MSTQVGHWRPSPAIKASALLHLGAVAGVAASAVSPWGWAWPWAAGALLANHALLTAAGLWPKSALLGPNQLRLNAEQTARQSVAITIDDGPNPALTPQILDLLDAANAKATFFCIGQAVQAHPGLAREIIARGHAVQNHSFTHRHTFSFSGLGALKQELAQAQDMIAQTTGQKPTLFRAPAGLRNPFLDPVLQRLQLRLVSWTRRGFDTVTSDPTKVQQRLETNLAAGDILLLHDGHCALDAQGQPVTLRVLPALLNTMKSRGLNAALIE
jgi:peptidoglycan-N-acetylglucosamine deacetylase